jgi:ribosomal protein S18 acetylase RimI-like enzyme
MKFKLVESFDTYNQLSKIVNKISNYVSKYDRDGSNQNCMLATWCLEAQLRGIDILPRPVYSPRDPIFSINGYDIVKNPIKLSISDIDDLRNKVTVAGKGSRFYCHVNWSGSSGGHEFVIINDVTIKIVDAQIGKIVDLDSDTEYFTDINYNASFIVRLDNKKLNEEILKYNDEEFIIEWDDEIDGKLLESTQLSTMYFLSDKNMDGKTLAPRVPNNFLIKNGYEDSITPRICFAGSIDKALMAISRNLKDEELYVHEPKNINKKAIYKPTIKEVPDVKITGEIWYTEPVELKCVGKIHVIEDDGKDGHRYTYGNNTAELYGWNWRWENEVEESLSTKIKRRDNENDFSPFGYQVDFYDNDNHIGTASVCGIKDNNAFLYDLEVFPEYRGKGYGNDITKFMINKYDIKQLYVRKDNTKAINLYKKFGFEITDDANDQEYLMEK